MTDPFPDVMTPAAAVTISEWTDIDHPKDTYRSFSGQRRGFDRCEHSNQGNYVEAFGTQNTDGTVEELAVRAELDVWDIGDYHHDWDSSLTSAEARKWGQRLIADAHEVLALADAFVQAADEVDGWAAS